MLQITEGAQRFASLGHALGQGHDGSRFRLRPRRAVRFLLLVRAVVRACGTLTATLLPAALLTSLLSTTWASSGTLSALTLPILSLTCWACTAFGALRWPVGPASLLARRTAFFVAAARRVDHRQRNAATFFVDRHHPHGHDVADRDAIVRILNELRSQLADVHQAGVLQADVDERAEIDDVQHRAHQLHAGRQIVELEDSLLEDRLRQRFARVAAGPSELTDDILPSVSVPTCTF